jgi:hypothetical protein
MRGKGLILVIGALTLLHGAVGIEDERLFALSPIKQSVEKGGDEARVDWGNFSDYFSVDEVDFTPNAKYSKRLTALVTAKRNIDSVRFTVQPYDEDGVKTPVRRISFIPNQASWQEGERARVWVDLPYRFLKVEIGPEARKSP